MRGIYFLCGGIATLSVVGLLIHRALASAKKYAAKQADKDKSPTGRN